MGLAKNEGNNIIKDHIIIMVPFPKVGNRAGSVSSVHSSYTVRGNCPHTKPATWRTRGCPDVKPFTLDQASMVGPSRGKTSTSSSPWKVTLHRMICNDNLYRNTALLRWNHVQGFWYFARSWTREIQAFPRNPTKFPKKREILRNPPEIFPISCRQNIFNTYLGY